MGKEADRQMEIWENTQMNRKDQAEVQMAELDGLADGQTGRQTDRQTFI